MIQAIYPTTPSQQGFILGTLTASPDDSLFIEQIAIPLAGPLDVDRFRATWRELIAAHEILRTGFAWNVSGEPRQVVVKSAELDIDLEEMAGKSSAAQQQNVERIMQRQRSKPFDLRFPPLVRLTLQRCGERDHVLICSHHHAIFDGWSQMKLLEEMLHWYHRSERRLIAPSFGKYAAWLAQQPLEERQRFWRAALRDHEPLLPLPVMNRPAQEERFNIQQIVIPQNQVKALLEQARQNDLTVASVLISLWAMALSQLRDSARIMVGVTVAGRSERFPQSSEILGPFVNTIPIGAKIDSGESFVAYAGAIQRDLARASQFDDSSAGQIHRWLGFSGDRPLFDSVIAIGNYPQSDIEVFARHGKLHFVPEQLRASGGRTLQPLSLVVSVQEVLTLRLVSQRDRVGGNIAAQLLDCIRVNIETFAKQGQAATVGGLQRGRAPTYTVSAEPNPAKEPANNLDVNSVEAVVAGVFATLLGVRSVGIDDDFIARGGHSILAIELLQTLCQRFHVDLTLHDLITAPTPAAVARRIRELFSPDTTSIELLPQITQSAESDEPFALTAIQAAYWVGRQGGFELGAVDSHLFGEVEVVGIDLERLNSCWQEMIRRHAMLRAVLTDDGKQFIQREVPAYTIAVTDLRSAIDVGQGIAAIRNRLSEIRRPVTRWPLFTIEAAVLPEDTTRLFLSFDLLIGDALSWKILYADVAALYSDPSVKLVPLEINYRDCVLAIEASQKTPAYQRDKEYWKRRLDTLPSPPAFPLRRAPDSVGDVKFRRREFRLQAPQIKLLRERAATLGVTPSTFLLAIFGEVLARFTSQHDFLMNLTVSNRSQLHPQINRLVGNFTSLSITAIHVGPPDQSFADSVRRLQRRLWEDLDHRLYSGLEVLRDLAERSGNPRSAQAPVVFTSTLEFSSDGKQPQSLPWKFVYGIGQTPQVLLDYQTFEIGDGVAIIWDAVDACFPRDYLDSMFRVHESLLKSIIDEGIHHADQFRNVKAPPPPTPHTGSDQRLQDPFIRQTRQSPDNVAIITDERQLSYRQLLNSAVDLAWRIGSATSERELVAVVMEKGWEQIVAILGVLMSGRAFVPLDPNWPANRICSLLSKTRACAVLTQHRVHDVLVSLTTAPILSVDESSISAADLSIREVPDIDTSPNSLAYVIFTSGSTGAPKGVMIQHHAALNTILEVNDQFAVRESDRAFSISPLVFDLSIYDIFGMLAAGGSIVIPREDDRTNPLSWLRMAAAHRISIWNSVPSLMDLLLDSVGPGDQLSLQSLRLCLLSGDWIPLALPDAVRKAAPTARVIGLGGATEGSIWSIFYDIRKVDSNSSSIPYGFALRGQSVEVLAPDLSPCETWMPGEIHIGGHGLAMGYWEEPALTTQSFVVDQHQRRLYRTGDRGRMRPDGAIEFLGRDDEQVKINGHRIELREVEAALAAVTGVQSAAVVAVGDRANRRLAGFFTGQSSASVARKHLTSVLPAYMIPTTLQQLAELPLSAVGKVNRDSLSKLASATADNLAPADEPAFTNGELISLVRKTIGLAADISVNLLSQGLTSIDVIRLLNAVERQFGKRPNIESFYRDPTIRGLQRELIACERSSVPKTRATPHDGTSAWIVGRRIADLPERNAFRNAVRPRKPTTAGAKLLSGRSIELEEYRKRRSARRFGDFPVSLETVSKMLECLSAAAIEDDLRFLYPSAGGLYAVELYIHFRPNRVNGLGSGLYRYDAVGHDLSPVVLDIDINSLLHEGFINEPLADTAALTMFLTTKPQNSTPLYGEDAEELALLNAGYMGQMLCQHAMANGLAICPLYGFEFDRIKEFFAGDGNNVLLHLLCCGVPVPRDDRIADLNETAGKAAIQGSCSPAFSIDSPLVLRTAPLSPGQERLLKAEYKQADGSWSPAGSSGRLRPIDTDVVLIEGELDIAAFANAINALVARHSALRTTVRFRSDGTPLQIITPPRPFDVAVEQRSDVTSSGVMQLVKQYSHAAVCPTKLDLFHAKLVRLSANHHVLFLSIHHLISDGWSIGIMFRDLSELYNSIVHSREPELPILDYTFDGYASEMSRKRADGRFENNQLAFWEKALRSKAVALHFPTVRSDDPAGMIDDYPVHLPRELVNALKIASAKAKYPGGLSGPFFTAMALVLQRICGERQIDIGCMVPGRIMQDSEFVIGFFMNSVTIRVNINPQMSVEGFISTVNEDIAAATQNQEVPIQDVAARLREKGSLSADQPPFQVTIALNDMRKESLTFSGVRCIHVNHTEHVDLLGPRSATSSGVKLRWVLEERADGLHGSVTFARDCFSVESIRMLIDCLTDTSAKLSQFEGTIGELISQPAANRPVLRS